MVYAKSFAQLTADAIGIVFSCYQLLPWTEALFNRGVKGYMTMFFAAAGSGCDQDPKTRRDA